MTFVGGLENLKGIPGSLEGHIPVQGSMHAWEQNREDSNLICGRTAAL